MSLATIDWLIIAAYMAMTLGIGIYLTRRASASMDDFFLSGRGLPWWLAGTSMVATSFSSDTPLYVTGLVRGHGIYENWQWWSFALSGMLAVSFFSRLWRRSGVVTDVQIIDLRYSGISAKILRGFKAVYFSCIIHTIIKAQVILAMVKILNVTVGWGKWESIVGASLVTLAYATMSGLWGIVVTDLLQFAIAMIGAVVLAYIAVDRAGGMDNIVATLEPETLSFFPPGEFFGTAFLSFFGYIGLVWWSRYSSDGGGVIVQRIAACRSEREGYMAAFYFNVANYALRTWPWVIAALASMVLYPTVTDHETIYPRMVVDLMPVGFAGLMLASFFAAFMSTLSTYLNLSSAYFVNDFYKPFLKPNQSDKHYVFISRVATILLSILTAAVTFHVDSIIGVFKFLIAFGSGTGLVYIVRWFWWRVNAWSEISAMLTSTVMSIIAFTVLNHLPYYGKLSLIISVSTVIWLAVTFMTSPSEMSKLIEFVKTVKPGGSGWDIVRTEGRRQGHEIGDPPKGESIYELLREWQLGVFLIFGLTIGIGKLLIVSVASSAIWFTLALFSAILLRKRFKDIGL